MYSLVDCNSFYCSCERRFQPQLYNRPLVVLSNNDGCAIARTDEAKALGIPMGAPAHELKEFVQRDGLEILSSNYPLYQDISDRVMGCLSAFTPNIEVYSIDEAFLDLKGLLHKDLYALGADIRATLLQQTGIPVGVGVAATKTLAKMANRFAKKHRKDTGVYVADTPEAIAEMMQATPVEDIWGAGSQRATAMRRQGYNTAAELLHAPESWVRKQFTVTGLRMFQELKGIASIAWKAEMPAKKAICISRSFGKVICSRTVIEQAVADYAEQCALKLRKQQSCAGRISVFLQTNPYRTQDKQYYHSVRLAIPVTTNDTPKLIKYALHALRIVYRPGYNYMRTGVLVDELVTESSVQLGLFSQADNEAGKNVLQAYDALNKQFGKGTVRFARQGTDKPYAARAARVSPRFTTRAADMLKIK